jgi:hypothetical protein
VAPVPICTHQRGSRADLYIIGHARLNYMFGFSLFYTYP